MMAAQGGASAIVAVNGSDDFNEELKALLAKCKIPVEVQAFFKTCDCLESMDIKYLGENEGEVVKSVKDNVDSAVLESMRTFGSCTLYAVPLVQLGVLRGLGLHRLMTRPRSQTVCLRPSSPLGSSAMASILQVLDCWPVGITTGFITV